MGDVTLETFREAAQKAAQNLDGTDETDAPQSERDELRGMISSALKKEDLEELSDEEVVRRVAHRVQERMQEMIWPEKGVEVKRRSRMMEVDKEAFRVQILREIRAIREEEQSG